MYADDILAITYTYVKDWGIAEDITQEVFTKYWQQQNQFRQESSLKTYLIRAAINRSKDYLKSWRYRTHLLSNQIFGNTRDKSALIEQEEYALLANAVFELPIELREIIILYFYQHYTYKEIAQFYKPRKVQLKIEWIKQRHYLNRSCLTKNGRY